MMMVVRGTGGNGGVLPEDVMLPHDTTRSMPIMLLQARDAVMSRFKPVLASHHLSEQQWRVMRVLGEAGELDASELAARASLLPPSLTRILRTLEQRSLVTRRVDEQDRRRVILAITPKCLELICKLTVEGSSKFANLLNQFGPEKWDELLNLLNELAALEQTN